MTEIQVSFFISVFFSNAKLAAICAPVFLFMTLLPRFAFLNTNENEVYAAKYATCLLPATAFSFGADIIAQYEYTGIGIQYSNLSTGKFNFAGILGFLVLDLFLYGFLAWYFNKVWPQEYGAVQPPWFMFSIQYWFPNTYNFYRYSHVPPQNIPELASIESPNLNDSIELIPRNMRQHAKIKLSGLSKRYGDGKVAVKNIALTMLEGQITCLLGHNGAGSYCTIYSQVYYSRVLYRQIYHHLHVNGNDPAYHWQH
jgi:hypothetical protein